MIKGKVPKHIGSATQLNLSKARRLLQTIQSVTQMTNKMLIAIIW